LALRLTGGQVHDITQAEALAAEAQPEALLGDKGYDADAFIESLEVRAIKPVIPPKSNRKVARDCDFALYAERNLIERFFQFIKQSEASRPATKKPRAIFSPDRIWSAPWPGSNEDTP
jgi:transposase